MLERSTLFPVLRLVPVLLIAACGGDGDDSGRLESGASVADFSQSGIEASQAEFNAADGVTAVDVDVTLRTSDAVSVAGRTVILVASGSGNTIDPPSTVTDANGVARFRFTSTVAEDKVLSARVKLGVLSLELSDTPSIQFVDNPVVQGAARYFDRNFDGLTNAGDELEIVFDQPMSIAGAGAGQLVTPVNSDSLGAGASLTSVDGATVVVAMADGAILKARQTFDPGQLANGFASGIDVAAASDFRGSLSGLLATPSTPADIEPGFVARQGLGSDPIGCVALGDLNCDGSIDVVLGGIEGAPTRVLRNVQGQLIDTGQTLGNGDTSGLDLGDVDRDGDLDLVVVSPNGENRLWVNDGSGMFPVNAPLGAAAAGAVSIADFNHDGALDVYVGTLQVSLDELYIGDGAGGFQRVLFGGTDVVALAASDYDRDGQLDIVTAAPSGALLVRLGRGDGTFFPPEILDAGFALHSLAAADLDGDGVVDLLVGGAGVRLARGVGDGGFQPFTPAIRADLCVTAIAPGDHDGDGDLDLALASTTGGALLWNLGDGNFSDPNYDPGTQRSNALATADLDGDGDLDLVDGTGAGTENLVLSGSLSGAWRFIGWPTVGPFFGTGTRGTTLDFDRDGRLDLAVVNGNQVNVYRGDGIGGFVLAEAKTSVDAGDVAAADFNGDGYTDLIVATAGNNEDQDRLLINDRLGGFLNAADLMSVGFTTIVRTADLENDGDLDAIFGDRFGGAEGRMVLNDGNGAFTGEIGIESALEYFDVADVNCDGWVDIVGSFDDGNSTTTVYLENLRIAPQTRFQANPITTDFVFIDAIVSGDFDSDGFVDFVAFGDNDGIAVNRLFRGDGNGYSAANVSTLPNNLPIVRTAYAVDVDADGDLDLVLGYTNDLGGILINVDGNGSFVDFADTVGITAPLAVDIDRDGDLDLLGVNRAALAR